MKTINFIIFFGIFFTIYGLINYYLFIRGWQAIPQGSPVRTLYLIVFLLFSVAFVAGRLLERVWLSPISEALVWIGSFWLAAMLYFFLAVVLLDLLRLVNHFFPFFPGSVIERYGEFKQWTLAVVVLIVAIVLAYGHLNASIPRVHELSIRIPKKVDGMQSMTIVSASDIHLGSIIGRGRFDAIVQKINALNPDLVLIPGDLVDEDLAPVIKENLGDALRTIRTRFGVLAITGNHEYIGGVEEACAYMAEHGITVLRDSVARVGPGIYVVGREDRSISQFSGKRRKSLEDLMSSVDKGAPVILLDHQPFGLDDGVRSGVDLQISGHTHHGQLWPLNYVTSAIYEVSWGYLKKENTHIYVSTGVGTWGPPVRIGNRPEILHITLTFE